jgi:hypothetical protein
MAPVTLNWDDLNAGQVMHSVGLLLDLDVGSLDVFLHEETVGVSTDPLDEYWERLGSMVPSGNYLALFVVVTFRCFGDVAPCLEWNRPAAAVALGSRFG